MLAVVLSSLRRLLGLNHLLLQSLDMCKERPFLVLELRGRFVLVCDGLAPTLEPLLDELAFAQEGGSQAGTTGLVLKCHTCTEGLIERV